MKTKLMRDASHLLPDPGGEVVRQCLAEIERLQKVVEGNHKPEVLGSAVAPGYTPEKLAEKFHTLYEAFAPEYGYETRKESAVAWEDVPEQNKKLMIRVCKTILGSV